MKKFIFRVLIFSSIIVVVDFGIGDLGDYLQANAKSGMAAKTNNLVMKDSHDIVILGSSRAFSHYDSPFLSEMLNLDVYNAGYDGNGVILAYGLLELMLERYRPKLVLFDIEPAFDIYTYSGDNAHIRYVSILKPYYRNTIVKEIIKDVSYREWVKVHSGMLRYNSKLIPLIIDNLKSDNDQMRGFKPLEGIYEDKGDENKTEAEEIDCFKMKYFEKMLFLIKSKHIPFAVVASPKYGEKSSENLSIVKEICNKFGIIFIDYYAKPEFVNHGELFRDSWHLNANGARTFSKLLINDIRILMDN